MAKRNYHVIAEWDIRQSMQGGGRANKLTIQVDTEGNVHCFRNLHGSKEQEIIPADAATILKSVTESVWNVLAATFLPGDGETVNEIPFDTRLDEMDSDRDSGN